MQCNGEKKKSPGKVPITQQSKCNIGNHMRARRKHEWISLQPESGRRFSNDNRKSRYAKKRKDWYINYIQSF